MINNVGEILDAIEESQKYISNFQMESDVGTKKMIREFHNKAIIERNSYINQQLQKFNDYKQRLFQTLKDREQDLRPKNTEELYKNTYNYQSNLEQLVLYNNPFNDIVDKLGFSQIISELSDADNSNLEKINELLKNSVEKFKQAGINLTQNDFNYSDDTYRYMNAFFNNYNSENFNHDMQEIFEQIYWECPMLITYLNLNLRNLIKVNEKKLEQFYQKNNNDLLARNNVTLQNLEQTLYQVEANIEISLNKDSYLNSLPFLTEKLSVDDYLKDSPKRKKNLDRFLINKEYENLSQEEQKNYQLEIENLDKVLVELEDYYYFLPYLKEIIERYKKKDTYKNVYKTKLKEIEKEESKRLDLYKKYQKATKKSFFNRNPEEKSSALKLQFIEEVKKINQLYTELDDAKINEKICTMLNDSSTLCDVASFLNSFYGFTKQLFTKNLEEENKDFSIFQKRLFNFVYSPNHTFMKKITIASEYDLIEMIYNKYKLLNINLKKEELTSENLKEVKSNVDYILTLYHLSQSTITIEEIKLILNIAALK